MVTKSVIVAAVLAAAILAVLVAVVATVMNNGSNRKRHCRKWEKSQNILQEQCC